MDDPAKFDFRWVEGSINRHPHKKSVNTFVMYHMIHREERRMAEQTLLEYVEEQIRVFEEYEVRSKKYWATSGTNATLRAKAAGKVEAYTLSIAVLVEIADRLKVVGNGIGGYKPSTFRDNY